MFAQVSRLLGLGRLRRQPDVDDRAAVLILFGRAVDELCSGLLVVLLPTLRSRLGLSVTQIGWCIQVLYSVAGVVEPIAGVAIDHVRRRPLLVVGAAGWGVSLLLAAGATGFGWLLAAFALIGLAAGPLTQTADVVLVEAHPDDVERIASRATWIDTIGALSAPIAVAVVTWSGWPGRTADPAVDPAAVGIVGDGRLLLVLAGLGTCVYALLLARTAVPGPRRGAADGHRLTEAVAGVREVLADRGARRWIVCLLLLGLFDPVEVFEPVWLADVAGFSQSLVGAHTAVAFGASLLATMWLDRWLGRHGPRGVLVVSCALSIVLYPLWMLVPGVAAKFVLVVLRDAAGAPLWPILRGRALAALPGRGGTVSAVTALIGLVPLHLLVGWLGERIGLTRVLLVVGVGAAAALLPLVRDRWEPDHAAPDRGAPDRGALDPEDA